MSSTERLYYPDSRFLEFDAIVVGLNERDDGRIAVTLNRTAFYPTGGGQPNDTGTLGDARVIDCIDAEEDGILHLIQGPVPEIGDSIHGKIDWLRRLDHTPCGGTHAKSTGEVGMIAVGSWERAKGLTRMQFMAGIRVLADYRKANRTAREIGALFSAGREDSPALVAKLIEENKKLARRVRELGEVACHVEAEKLLRA